MSESNYTLKLTLSEAVYIRTLAEARKRELATAIQDSRGADDAAKEEYSMAEQLTRRL